MKKKLLSLLLCGSMVATMFAGCKGASSGKSTGGKGDYSEELTLDVYDDFANYNGEQTGWFAKIVKDKFNIKLNIIAPNVAGGGDTLYQTRTAAGDLGDLILVGTSNGRLKDLVDSGLVLDLSDYMKDKKVTKNYGNAIKAANKGLNGTYAMPYSVSKDKATVSGEGTEPTFGPYVRWDYYKEMGYPEVKDLNGLLDMLEKMQAMAREKEGKKDIYAFSFFKDWDGNMMNNAKQPTCMYGYDELGFILSKFDGSDDVDILNDKSPYLEVLKLFYEANKRGLVDPDSTTQNYDTMSNKYSHGKILFCPWPWASKSLFNTQKNTKNGKGYEMIPISNMKIFSYGATPDGNTTQAICIGSKAKDPQRIADFVDWLYSPEGVECNQQGNGTQGPKGLTWDMKDGKPYITEFGKKALPNNDTKVPKEWGGGSWKDGVSALNFKCVSMEDPDPNAGGEKYDYTNWESYLEMIETPIDKDWSEHMGGAKTTMEYLTKNDMLGIAPGTTYSTPEEDSNISTIRGQVKQTIVDNSWKMIFAKDDAEFDSIKANMIKTAKGLGYEDCLKVDFKNAKDQNAARKKAASK